MPPSVSELPFARPWSDSTRPIAATSCHGRWQLRSAALITVAARAYAVSATAGIPLADAVATTWSAWRWMPSGEVVRRSELLGGFTAWDGTRVPSGSVCGSAEAEVSDPVVASPAVQAADSTASGNSADAFCARPNVAIDCVVPSLTPV